MSDEAFDSEAGGWAERLVDELVPIGVEWRRLVHDYPRAALGVAAVSGFLLGRTRGLSVAAALSGFVMGEVAHGLETAAHSVASLRDELQSEADGLDDPDDRGAANH